jgi:hypothetical protein
MNDAIYHDLLAMLVLIAAVSCGASIAGLAGQPRTFWHAFWLMTGLWGAIDAAIAAFALAVGPMPPADLAPILRFNMGLDGLYIAIGAILGTRPTPRPCGFGIAVVVQGIALLALDLYFYRRCEAVIAMN